MEGNIFVLLISMVLAAALIIVSLVYGLGKAINTKSERTVKSASRFERVNEIIGYVHVDGRKIRTFNLGKLMLDNTVALTFYNNFNSPIRITDIELKGKSLYSYAPQGLLPRDKADYAITVLKQSANQQLIPMDLAQEVEEMVLDVDTLNEYMKAGRIVQIAGHRETFEWRG